ncbi:MAG: hypothetical protein AAFO69_14275 [Bacteroidota bacterium]
MRYIKKVSALLLLIGFLGFGTSSSGTPNEQSLPDDIVETEDLRCVIRDIDGNKLAACWFCDCQVLAYAIYPIIIRE